MTKRKSNWSKMIEEAGFRIRIYERPNGAGVYFSFIIDGKKTQRSTRRTDRKEAEEYARIASSTPPESCMTESQYLSLYR